MQLYVVWVIWHNGVQTCQLLFYLTAAHCIAGKHGLLATGFYFLLTVQAVFLFLFNVSQQKSNKL